VSVYGCLVAGIPGRAFFVLKRVGVIAAEGDGPEPRIGGEDAVIAVAVDRGRWDQTGQGFETFQRRECENGAVPGVGRAGW
jgi:hypothetical protein